VVLVALGFFCWKTVFSSSKYARRARKFTKPGFDEKVLEPLDYAFGDDDEFDSSLNGAFNDHELAQWKADLKVRGIFMLIFIVVMWVLMSFSMLIPQSERFSRFSAPFVEFFGITPEAEAETELPPLLQQTLKRGDQGDAVRTLQQFLFDRGLTRNKPDGDYGRGTEKVVKAFQQANGLEATGAVDDATLAAINKIAAAVAAAEAANNAANQSDATDQSKAKESKVKAKETTQPKATETTQPTRQETAQPKAKPVPQPQREESSQPDVAPVAPASSGEKTVSLDQLMKMNEKKKETSNP
jgi:peptidoglycan hydrolase-like protein with peptidoglycan-binding domain